MAQKGQSQAGGQSEREDLIRGLVRDLESSFMAYLNGELEFADVTFEVFDTLETVHAVGTGNYTVEYLDEDEDIEMQEELAQEPIREAGGRQPRAD